MPTDPSGQSLDALWEAVRQRLRAAVPDSTFKIWLEPVRVVGAQGTTLYLSAPEGIRTWVERRYAALLREALDALGSPLSEIAFSEPDRHDPGGRVDRAVELNPNYSFDRFVIGEGNRVAHAAALAVAETPSEAYNPLFLHGPPGLGKTHLLGAVANYLRANAPGLSVRYTTAEGFTNEFVGALRSSGAEQFKQRYRDLDVLLVDDIQFLQGKQHTEEEFFHTFNALYEGGSQLVLSADRLPSELSTLEARLRDRFEWGLTIPVEPPDLATRLTVLQRLAREAGLGDDDRDALAELAGRIDANIRRLHGALTKVIAHASLTAKPLSPELIAELIPSSPAPSGPTAIEAIQERVAGAFGVSRAELVGSGRSSVVLRARQVAILLTRESTDLSLPQIGRLYGGRDHSTVLNALRRAEDALGADAELARQVGKLRTAIHRLPPGAA
ncbi:MAG TPA: chromosomal replication initiator protein DnaA [Solirubrobacterales bacterium]|nr:chromosomal replication initiator protein DnaA [Solirubrobacterales bacterium]